MALSMAACGKAGDKKDDSGSSSSSGGSKTIGLLLPDSVTARYEKFDKPYFEAKVSELCSDCKVEYANAAGDAAKQAQQVSSMITKGVKVIVISAQDSAAIKSSIQTAVDKGIKVVAYDRLARARSPRTSPSTTSRSASSRARRFSTRWAPRPPRSPRSS